MTMRVKILFEAKQDPLRIPWDYRTILTAKIYEILAASDPQYSHWLHEQGFRKGNRVYRLFVYSDLKPSHWQVDREGLLASPWLIWQVGSPDQQFIEKLMKGLEHKRQSLEIFGTSLEILDMVRMEPSSLASGLVFHTISPIAASKGNPTLSKHPIYLSPDQPGFVEALEQNLITKWEAFHGKAWNGSVFGIRVWEPKQKLVPVFNITVRAWHLKLQMWGAEELIRFAYDAGLGIKNSQGFGMIEPGV